LIPLTDDGHCSRGLGSDKGVDGRVLKFPSTSPNELRVTLYDPLRGVPVVELEVIKEAAVIRFYLDYRALTKGKSHNCGKEGKLRHG